MTRHERRSAKVEGSGPRWLRCGPCQKRGYTRKSEAKAIARRLTGEKASVYRCPAKAQMVPLYHVGNLPANVRSGEMDRVHLHQLPRRR